MKPTYGDLWDHYVAESFPRLQQSSERKLTYPGEEWGSEATWKNIFARLFTSSEVENWEYAIEIGGGGGKYTERVLAANDKVKVWGFDVSRNFLEATGARLSTHVEAGRLSLNEIDPVQPDRIFQMLDDEGLRRKVDAMFSIDAMVHVDIQYLLVYWINAALLLKPGGRLLMTLADPTSPAGLQKIRRDIRSFYKQQGRMCPKFEYLSEDIVRGLLTRIGFDIVWLEQWSYFEDRPARDLYLIAELARPDDADRFRDALRADPSEAAPAHLDGPETYSQLWDRCLDTLVSGEPAEPRPSPIQAVDALLGDQPRAWTRAIEIGGGDTQLTEHVLSHSSELTVMEFSIGGRAADVYRQRTKAGDGRLKVSVLDPAHPDGIYKACESAGWVRTVDAVFSLNVLPHIDLQYAFAHLINAALVLRKGGVLLINVADATSEKGAEKLIADIRRYFAYQGRACPRFDYQSPQIMRLLLNELGFDIEVLENWTPNPSIPPRDLYVVATMQRPEQADDFRADVSLGLPLAKISAKSRGDMESQDIDSNASAVDLEIARALGQAYWRQLLIQSNPDMSREDLKSKLRESWGGSRREFTRLGHTVLRQMRALGFSIQKSGGD